jgi:hypothetical protein
MKLASDPLLRRSVCAAGQPACPQVSRCIGLSGSDRKFPALTGRSGTQRARRLRSRTTVGASAPWSSSPPTACRGWPASGPGRLRPGPWFLTGVSAEVSGIKRDFACTFTRHLPLVLVVLRSESRLMLEGRTRTLSGPSPDLSPAGTLALSVRSGPDPGHAPLRITSLSRALLAGSKPVFAPDPSVTCCECPCGSERWRPIAPWPFSQAGTRQVCQVSSVCSVRALVRRLASVTGDVR